MAVSHPAIRGGPLDIDGRAFAETLHHPFPVRHSLADHPLLTLDALAELADRLPAVHRAPPRRPRPHDARRGPEARRAAAANRPRDRDANAWMVLWYIEQDPAYRELLDECLDEVVPHVADEGGYIPARGLHLPLRAELGDAVHLDPEHNLLLQIRGNKKMTSAATPTPAEQRARSSATSAAATATSTHPELERQFVMHPRDGVYVYLRAALGPQRPGASISLSITFRTENSLREERIRQVNARLRRLHLSPKPPGVSRWRDEVKAHAFDAARRMRGHRGDTEHGNGGAG